MRSRLTRALVITALFLRSCAPAPALAADLPPSVSVPFHIEIVPAAPLTVAFTPAAATVPCDTKAGTVIATVTTAGGNGKPITPVLSGSTNFALRGSQVVVAPAGIAVPAILWPCPRARGRAQALLDLEERRPGIIEAAERRFGRLDVIVANAGIGSYARPSRCRWPTGGDRTAVNLDGVFLSVKYAPQVGGRCRARVRLRCEKSLPLREFRAREWREFVNSANRSDCVSLRLELGLPAQFAFPPI
jgi:hypothetical protein